MRKLLVTTFVSLDGVMEAPGGGDEVFEHDGWAVPHISQDVIRLMAALTGRADALLLGRKTYDIFAATWPIAGADDPIGAKLNGMRKYVASHTLSHVSWHNSTLLTGDVAEAVDKLKRDGGGEIQVHGSGDLVQTLVKHDLVDEFHLVVIPVLVGSGRRLFAAGTIPANLKLVESTAFGNGVLATRYARDGELTYGAIGPETGNW